MAASENGCWGFGVGWRCLFGWRVGGAFVRGANRHPRKKGLRGRNSPMCTLSQNGYGDKVLPWVGKALLLSAKNAVDVGASGFWSAPERVSTFAFPDARRCRFHYENLSQRIKSFRKVRNPSKMRALGRNFPTGKISLLLTKNPIALPAPRGLRPRVGLRPCLVF